MALPTQAEEYAKLMEYLRKAQESCAMIAHLHNSQSGPMSSTLASGWLGMSELMKRMQYQITELAKSKLN